jgi:hypothetical protein
MHGELVGPLKALGITDVFDRSQADLSDMVDQQTPLWVGKVLQKAFIVVSCSQIAAESRSIVYAYTKALLIYYINLEQRDQTAPRSKK